MTLGGAVLGFALARLAPWNDFALAPARPSAEARASADASGSAPVASAAPGALDETPVPAGARPAPKKKPSSLRRPVASADRKDSSTGLVDVTAPDGAEIWLDGRRIGTGSTRRRIAPGAHRVEVRHRGAKVGESFHVEPGETWTYAVTPR